MKYAIITLLAGYLVIWQWRQVQHYILPVVVIWWLIFAFSVMSKRIEAMPTFTDKIRVIINIFFTTIIIVGIAYFSLQAQWISIWYYPPIFAGLVLFRKLFKKLINLSIKEPKGFGVISETERGETVKSKSEKKVADWLYANGYDYQYERKITLADGQIILSDFYLPKYDIYMEYWGLSAADNEAGERYRERKTEKIELYQQHGYKLMDVYPHHLYELDNYIPQQIKLLTGRSWWSRLFGWIKRDTKPRTDKKPIEQHSKLYCTNCGNEIEQIGDFCVKCGNQAT